MTKGPRLYKVGVQITRGKRHFVDHTWARETCLRSILSTLFASGSSDDVSGYESTIATCYSGQETTDISVIYSAFLIVTYQVHRAFQVAAVVESSPSTKWKFSV